MPNSAITFTIPFYENEDLLRRAINSVLSQTLADWRLIISLDSQLSIEFISYFEALNDSRITVIKNADSNKGICGN
jgi:glycosyltransferase involved in cell wall biosynthesis